MKQYMTEAFCRVYGMPAEVLSLTDTDRQAVSALHAEYGAWEYVYGTPLPFTFQCEARYPWGYVQLQLTAKDGSITGATLYSDAMDWSLPAAVETALTGCRFETAAMQTALQNAGLGAEHCKDLCNLIAEQSL